MREGKKGHQMGSRAEKTTAGEIPWWPFAKAERLTPSIHCIEEEPDFQGKDTDVSSGEWYEFRHNNWRRK